jgi:putrescine transport system permease protein
VDQFFGSRDWPAASAVAVMLLACWCRSWSTSTYRRELEEAADAQGPSWFNITSFVAAGLAFLYLPIAILVIYSFNDSRLVAVWGWLVGPLVCCSTTAPCRGRPGRISASRLLPLRARRPSWGRSLRCAHALRPLPRPRVSAMIYAPLVMPEVIGGLSLLLLFVALSVDRGFWTVTIAHTTLTMCFVAVIVQARATSTRASKRRQSTSAARAAPFLTVTLPLIAPAALARASCSHSRSRSTTS